jgi:hypothetical protein
VRGVATRVAALLAAEPEAAEAGGLRPVWLTLQALSAQDSVPLVGDVAPVNTTAAATESATAPAAATGELQHGSMQSGMMIAAGDERMAIVCDRTNDISSVPLPPEAVAGRETSSWCNSQPASPLHCSSCSSSDSHDGDAFEQLKTMGAVLRHSISRTGSSGSDGSLWGDSAEES